MSGLIQRLLDRSGAAMPQAAPARPAAISGSPLAAHDQRLQDPMFRDAGIGMPDFGGTDPDVAPVASDPSPLSPPRSLAKPTDVPLPEVPTPKTPSQIAPTTWQQIEDPIAALRAAAPIASPPLMDRPAAPSASLPEPKTTIVPSLKPSPLPVEQFLPDLPDQTAIPSVPVPMPATEAHRAKPKVATAQEQHQSLQTEPPARDVPKMIPTPLPTPISDHPTPQAAPQPQPELIRPATPTRAMPELPRTVEPAPSQPATQERQREVERIIERVTRQEVAAKPDPQAKVRSEKPTAQNVSRIGSLPTRRRSHTIFGSRRG